MRPRLPLLLHAFALAVVNLAALRVGHAWDAWVHLTRPFAAQIPVGTLLSLAAFLVWVQLASALAPTRFRLDFPRHWRSLLGAAVVFAAVLFIAMGLLSGTRISAGRLATVAAFQILTNPLAFVLCHAVRDVRFGDGIRRLARKPAFKPILALVLGTMLALGVVGVVEGAFKVLERRQAPGPVKVYEGPYLEPGALYNHDPRLGTRATPDAVIPCRLLVDGEEVWDVTYRTEAFGRRVTTHPDAAQAEQFAIFFGCSYLFGEGCEDGETLPSQFAERRPEFRAYNYGFPGWGPQQMLAMLEEGFAAGEIAEPGGRAFFLYLEEIHEPRVCGDMSIVNAWGRHFPCYELDREGALVHRGSFAAVRPVRTAFYALLKRSATARYLQIDFPRRRSEADYRLLAAIFAAAQDRLRADLGASELAVILYPTKGGVLHRRLLPHLEELGVPWIDLGDLFAGEPGYDPGFGPADGHPNPRTQGRVAEVLDARTR